MKGPFVDWSKLELFRTGWVVYYNFLHDYLSNDSDTRPGYIIKSNIELSYKETLDNVFLVPVVPLRALAGISFLRELEIMYDLASSQEEKTDINIKLRAIEISKRSGIISSF